MRLQWSGDVDLNSGELQQAYKKYRDLLELLSNLSHEFSVLLLKEKEFLIEGIHTHLIYLCSNNLKLNFSALKKAEQGYHQKSVEGKCNSNDLFSTGWTVEELQKLITDQQQISVNLSTFQDQLADDSEDYASNVEASQNLFQLE